MSQNGETCKQEADSSVVFEVNGEPAVVINGLPKNISCKKKPLKSCHVTCDMQQADDPVFGELLEGRKVQKMFGGQYYNGEVVKYDSEVNWYRVVYEDGDSEDLEWHELEEVLLPLDINIPLKSMPFQSCLHEKYFFESKITMPTIKNSYPIMEKTLEPCQIGQQLFEVPVQIDYKSWKKLVGCHNAKKLGRVKKLSESDIILSESVKTTTGFNFAKSYHKAEDISAVSSKILWKKRS